LLRSLGLANPFHGGWPTFTFFVKVGTHAAGVAVFILASPHRLIRTDGSDCR